MSAFKILSVIGNARNLIKIAPLIAELKHHSGVCPYLVHTGTQYEQVISDPYFDDLEIPRPDFCLNIGSGSFARQVALMIQELEGVLLDVDPDLVVVLGDVNSTVATSITAVSLGYPVAHIEAGLRTFDREMPEEINGVVTDSVSDLLFTTEPGAVKNLLSEGRPSSRIFFVGNMVIETLLSNADKIARSSVHSRLRLNPRTYAVLTLQRPCTFENADALSSITAAIEQLQNEIAVVFPLHPSTSTEWERFASWQKILSLANVHTVEPVGYIDFIKLMKESLFVMTDTGSVQDESTALGVPCLTLRESTERPVTVTEGTNQLVGSDYTTIVAKAFEVIRGVIFRGSVPEKWDGLATKRIVSLLLKQEGKIRRMYSAVKQRGICLDLLSRA
ncbi:MAG: UDP-N-acetylglucosamine 2-epimerase (non-hydrolyzing) [Acidobacteria bacterium]|nr:UDP-N-acetylglucosamine 2-epimerase (non-hydrolyzing) [Acidobacteriota bacterium]